MRALNDLAARNELDYQHDERHDEQQVNEIADSAKAEAERPKNQQDDENVPEHCGVSLTWFEMSWPPSVIGA
jgi:hypothetical protein